MKLKLHTMPKQVLPSLESMERFMMDLFLEKFRKPLPSEYPIILHGIDGLRELGEQYPSLVPMRHRNGLESAFVYRKDDVPCMVIVWTTFIEHSKEFRKSDAGWVIIIDLRTELPIWYSFPQKRTEHFLERMRSWAFGFKNRVDTWPKPCEWCSEQLTITRVPSQVMHQVAFACPKHGRYIGAHRKCSVYQGMGDEHVAFISDFYKRYDAYVQRERAAGSFHKPQRVIRAEAKKKRLQKVVPKAKKTSTHYSSDESQLNPLADQFPFSDTQYD